MVVIATPPPTWRLRGIGKLNGSAADALIWHDPLSGAVGVWTFDSAAQYFPSILGTGAYPWEIFGSANLDGSGSTELIWSDVTSNYYGAWFINGTSVSYSVFAPNPGSTWRLQPNSGN
jgi:hypothetical protein